MFDRLEVTRLDRPMGVGRTRPLLMVSEGAGLAEIEVVAKFSAGCSVAGLVREAIGAMLASDLGLPTPPPYLVHISDEFVGSVADPEIAGFLRASCPYGFGSQRLPDGFSAWVPPGGRMSPELEQEAIDILAFDCWVTNPDRRVDNQNLLTDGRYFAIFDHELALMTTLNLFWREPWSPGALEGAHPPHGHVFFDHLRGRAEYPLVALNARLAALTDARVHEYREALPPEWIAEAGDAVDAAAAYIMLLRDNVAPAYAELRRALS